MKAWAVFRVQAGDRLNLVYAGSSDAKSRDRAILDVAISAGEYIAIPMRYAEAAIVHAEPRYSISARVSKALR